jgi:hypothetical protein
MATARLGHAALLLRDRDVAWRTVDLIGQSPLPGNRVSLPIKLTCMGQFRRKPRYLWERTLVLK